MEYMEYYVQVHLNGAIKWHDQKTGFLHRVDGPAIEVNGSKFWYQNGKLHRVDGPAIEYVDGSKHWLIENKLHRVDGPAIEKADGFRSWYMEDKQHRVDGPACEWKDGSRSWYVNGLLHREDGPAMELPHDYRPNKQYYLNGVVYDKASYDAELNRRNSPAPCDGKVVEIDGKKYKLTEVK